MNALTANVFDNPILLRELRRRMRGKALVWSIMSYIALMTLSTVFVLLAHSPSPFAPASIEMLQKLHTTGENVYLWITGIQSLLVLIIAPTITAGMTTGEKERQTFDFLRVTTISRWMYVMGCFLSTAFYVALALICALPLLSLSFLYGGVALNDVLRTFFVLLGGSCVLSAFGLYVSSVCERTRTAQGIIVFLIFAMLFGSFLSASVYRVAFAGDTCGSGASGTALYVFNTGVPRWMVFLLSLVGVTTVFLLLAARKLFEPEEVRAFSHWQFALVYAAALLGGLGFLNGNMFTTEVVEMGFMATGFVLLAAAAQTFAVGRMEVGDEIWHLKRLFPILRPVDQTVPFLVALGFGWYVAMGWLPIAVKTLNSPLGLIPSFKIVSLTLFALLVFFARGMTGITGSRRKAGLYSIMLLAGLTIVLPLLASVLNAMIPDLDAVWTEVYSFSPIAMLFDAFRHPNNFPATGVPVGTPAALVYGTLAVAMAIGGEYARWKRWHGFDYHYDMPVG